MSSDLTHYLRSAAGRLRLAIEQRAGKARRTPDALAGADDYQRALESTYEDWARELARELADTPETERQRRIDEALAALLLLLQQRARQHFSAAINEATGGEWTPEAAEALAVALRDNDGYLRDSLIPAVRDRVNRALSDAALLAALLAGSATLFNQSMDALIPRVALYAGAWWILYHNVLGQGIQERGSQVIGYLDPRAKHCIECPLYHSERGSVYESMDDYLAQTGGRVPGQFQCDGNCRCWLEEKPNA